jgi:hypothetical protein
MNHIKSGFDCSDQAIMGKTPQCYYPWVSLPPVIPSPNFSFPPTRSRYLQAKFTSHRKPRAKDFNFLVKKVTQAEQSVLYFTTKSVISNGTDVEAGLAEFRPYFLGENATFAKTNVLLSWEIV